MTLALIGLCYLTISVGDVTIDDDLADFFMFT